MRVKWLHLSDIHFNYKNYESAILRRDFLKRVRSLAESETFTHLVLSGDILHKNNANDEDNTHSTVFIHDLIDAMGINTKNVVIVPGNHDHDRSVTIRLVQDIYANSAECDNRINELSSAAIEELLKAFSKYEVLYKELLSREYYGSYDNPHTLLELDGLSIICLNTAWLDIDSSNKAILRCGRKQLLNLLEQNEERLKHTVNIAVGHHPMEDFFPEEKDNLLALFHRFNIGLYFCGHRHKPSIDHDKEKDVLQITCPGAYHDGYSTGGYVYGIIDTDSQFYKAEFYNWKNDDWYIESSLKGTNERGVLYFNTKRYQHNNHFAAVDLCVMGPHISRQDLAQSIGEETFNVHVYPYSNIDIASIDWDLHYAHIRDLAVCAKHLNDKGDIVHLYPLAPIPLLIAMGFELQNNSRIIIHQRARNSGHWVCGECNDKIDYTIYEKITGQKNLVLKISCAYEVQDKQIREALSEMTYDQIEVKASRIEPGYPLYREDILRVADKIFEKLDKIINQYDALHIFAAIPAGMAVELGRRMLQTVYYNVVTYQLSQRKYVQALVLNSIEIKSECIKQLKENVFYVEDYDQNVIFVPILGEIACGAISEAILESDEYLPLSSSVLGSGEHYIIKADGDSMTNAGIDDGDLIIVRRQDSADDGQIVVAIDGDRTTLKRMYHDNKRRKIILRAAHPAYEDQEFDDIKIQGVAIKVIKSI